MIQKYDDSFNNDDEEDNDEEDSYEVTDAKRINDDYEYRGDIPFKVQFDYEAVGERFEIEPNQLRIIKAIGEGYYSDVYMGMLRLKNENLPVAVKTPKAITGSISETESKKILRRQREAIRDELNILAHLQLSAEGGHQNVLKPIGAITTIKADFCLLTEYCECGSLDHFLQRKYQNGTFENEIVSEEEEKEEVWKMQRDPSWNEHYQLRRKNGMITTSDLLWFALQIARAMHFLAEKNIIHRDVAVRNVLLKSDFTIKVADFGLSRKLKEGDEAYYVWKGETALPVRYTAPESLKSERFSITSEYWSFGVVIWELFTFAEKQPYSEEYEKSECVMEFRDFLVEYLSSGHRLSLPNIVPKHVKKLLTGLWHSDSKQRPSFQACKSVIKQVLMQSCPNIIKEEEKKSDHSSEYSVFQINEDANVVTSKNRYLTSYDSTFSASPSSETIQIGYLKITLPRKFRWTLIGIGIALIILAVIVVTLSFTVFINISPNHFHVTNNSTVTNGSISIQDEVEDLVRKNAEEGNVLAQNSLALKYHIGYGVNISYEEAIKWYRKAAEQGYAIAQNNLGAMYERGQGVNQSYEEAVKWYRKAAEQDNAVGQSNLGVLYANGQGVNQSYEEAVKWLTKSAEQGYEEAQNNLGRMYENGRGVTQSYEEAIKWYKKAAEQDYAIAQNNLGRMYETGQGVTQSYEEAAKWYRKAAEQDNAVGQSYLGVMYATGQGVNQSYEEAMKWLTKAAEQGHTDAQANLGEMYENGHGVLQSYEEALKLYKEAAEQGNLYAQNSLRILSDKMQGIVPQSDNEAFLWYKTAADQGNTDAQYKLGFLFFAGRGVNESYEEAVKWYTKAAEQGNADGQANLAYLYENGIEVSQSYKEAIKWYIKAAEQGNVFSQYNLGRMNENGLGFSKSCEEAVKWYKRAAEQGYAAANRQLQVINDGQSSCN